MYLKDALTFSADGKTLVKCDENYEGNVVVPSSASELGGGSTSVFARMFSAVIPNKVTTIGKDAFLNCRRITSVVLPDSIREIEGEAFLHCSNLASINIPNGVRSIGGLAFMGCSNLASIDIPSSVNEIGMYAFSGCTSIRRFNVDRDNENYCSVDGVLYSKNMRTLYQVPACCENYTIPGSVLKLDYAAFNHCARLNWIEIPESVISIASGSVFEGCLGLKSFVVDANNRVYRNINGALCSKDGKELIRVPDSFGSFAMPDSIVTIKESAMTGCAYMPEVYVSRNVRNIEYNTFNGMTSNKRFTVAKDNPYYCDMNGAICSKDGRTLLHVPKGLESFTVPDGIVYIDVVVQDEQSTAFEGCEKLTSLTIPSSVREIGDYSFLGCDNLVEIHMKHRAPMLFIHDDAELDSSRVTLFVPYGSEAAYRAHPFYSQFTRILGE